MKTALIILQILFLFVVACDHGLDPETDKEKPGIEGIVTVLEPWPDTLGVREVYIIVFREIPVDSASAVEQFFSGGVSFAGPFQPGGQVYPFSIDMDPGVYRFVSCVGLRVRAFSRSRAGWFSVCTRRPVLLYSRSPLP
jgi:hypothetical protein